MWVPSRRKQLRRLVIRGQRSGTGTARERVLTAFGFLAPPLLELAVGSAQSLVQSTIRPCELCWGRWTGAPARLPPSSLTR